jgi:hypothetical protein
MKRMMPVACCEAGSWVEAPGNRASAGVTRSIDKMMGTRRDRIEIKPDASDVIRWRHCNLEEGLFMDIHNLLERGNVDNRPQVLHRP